MKSPFKVMSTAALAAAVAVPTLSVPAADAAETSSFHSVALETEDGSVKTVPFMEYAKAKTFGTGELGAFVEASSVVAVSAEEGKFVSVRTLALAKIENTDADTASLLADLDDSEDNLVAEEDVADYTEWTDEEEVVAPAVESVSANTLKNVTVNFNSAVDADTVDTDGTADDTVKVYLNGSEAAETLAGSALSEDGTELNLSLSALNQSDEVKVVVDGVESTDGTALEAYEESLTVKDVAAPEAEQVEVVNNKTLKLHFSEPVNLDTAGIYKTTDVNNINAKLTIDGELKFAKFNAVPEENYVEVQLFNELADGSHEVTLSEVKDFAGFKVEEFTSTINTVDDTTAPVATGVEYVSRNEVKLNFSEELAVGPTGTFEVYEAGNATNLSGTTTLSADKKSVTVSLSTPFSVAATVGFDVKYKGVQDIFGNANTDVATVSGQATDDSTKPQVSNVEVETGNLLKVTFSEKVNAAGQTSQFSLYDADGNVVAASADAVTNYDSSNPDGKTFEVTFNALSDVNANGYSLKVSGTKDTSIRQNVLEDKTITFTSLDSQEPSVVAAVRKADSGDNDKIEVVFSESMDYSTISDLGNYVVGNGGADTTLDTVSGAKIESISSDNKKVVLVVPDADNSDSTGGFSAIVNNLALLSVKDAAGNLVDNASISSPFSVTGTYDTFLTGDVKAYATSNNTIVVESTDASNLFAANQPAGAFDFNVQGSADTTDVNLGVTAAQVSADGTKVTLTFADALTADAMDESGLLELVIAANSGVKDQNGSELSISEGTASAAVADDIDATQISTTANNDTITLDFDEAIAYDSSISGETNKDTILAGGLTLTTADGTELTPNVDYTASVANGDLVVTVTNSSVDGDVTVELTKPQYLQDTATTPNDVNASAASTVTVATPSALVSGSLDNSFGNTTPVVWDLSGDDNLVAADDAYEHENLRWTYTRNSTGTLTYTVRNANDSTVYYQSSGQVTTTGEKAFEWSFRDEETAISDGLTQAEAWASDNYIVPSGTDLELEIDLNGEKITKTYTMTEEDVKNADHLSVTTEDHQPLVTNPTVTEASNDGSINSVVVTSINQTFDSGISTANVTVNNLPDGLTVDSVVHDSNNQITINFAGNATSHTNSDDVTNASVTVEVQDPYTAGSYNLTTEDFTIDFQD